MSDLWEVTLDYETAFTLENGSVVVQAVKDVVDYNWTKYADRYTGINRICQIEEQDWINSWNHRQNKEPRFLSHQPFHFSPTSSSVATLYLYDNGDGNLSVSLEIASRRVGEMRNERPEYALAKWWRDICEERGWDYYELENRHPK